MSNRLLYALSAKGVFKIEEFYEAISREWGSIDASDEGVQLDRRLEYVRMFDALGFSETNWGRRQIYATPTTWALLPTFGLPTAALVGGRSPSLLSEIRKEGRLMAGDINLQMEERSWMSGTFPKLVLATGSSMELLLEFCKKSGGLLNTESAAWMLANSATSLSDLVLGMKYNVHGEPQNWRRSVFDVDRGRFVPESQSCGHSFYASYTNPTSLQKIHVSWNGDVGAEVPRDWGRYLSFNQAGKQVLGFDSSRQAMSVPATAPLPPILLRALAMCSARLPIRKNKMAELSVSHEETPYNIFLSVPRRIANMVSEKLGQQLVDWDIPEANGSVHV